MREIRIVNLIQTIRREQIRDLKSSRMLLRRMRKNLFIPTQITQMKIGMQK